MKRKEFEQPVIERETAGALSLKLLSVTGELVEAKQKLERVQQERSEMLANISHDLRAPITAVRSAVDYLKSGKALSEDDYCSALKLIDRRIATLESLIQDMYYLFSVEDTSRKLSLQAVDPALFLEEYYYDALVDVQFEKYNLNLDISDSLSGKRMNVDIPKIVRVLDNLLVNAVKYSAEGTDITIKAECLPEQKAACVSVADKGVGIPEEALGHIFERAYVVSSARTPGAAAGSGLGLSIVKAIVERHQGRVWCESVQGKGSSFSFTLPLADS